MMAHIYPGFVEWLINNIVVGSVFILCGCAFALLGNSPIRRLKILEATLVVSIIAPIFASPTFPFEVPIKLLPAVASTSFTYVGEGVGESSGNAHTFAAESQSVSGIDRIADDSMKLNPGARPWEWMDVAVMVQIAATIVLACIWLLGVIAVHRIWKRARPEKMDPDAGLGECEDSIQLRSYPGLSSPCAYGIFQRRILIPRDLMTDDSKVARTLAIRHELSHLRRGDLWTWRLTRLAALFFWFHPAYWWLRREVRLIQDYLADSEASVECGANRFAEFLVDFARMRHPVTSSLVLPLFGRDSNLSKRVARLIHSDGPLETRNTRGFLVGLTLCSGLLLVATSVLRLESKTLDLVVGDSDRTEELQGQQSMPKELPEASSSLETPSLQSGSDLELSPKQIETENLPTERQYPYVFQFGQAFFPVDLEPKDRRVVIDMLKFDKDWGDTVLRVENPGPGNVLIWNVRIEVLSHYPEDDSVHWEIVSNDYPSGDWEGVDIDAGSSVKVKKVPPEKEGTWRMVISYQRRNLDPQKDLNDLRGDFEVVGPIIPKLKF